ncbi:MAG: hypothetical protein GXP31_08375 [Kiritimatiellaeota bacterium]|nr:hypothetical protein [Kiritimatiellota bacterium]
MYASFLDGWRLWTGRPDFSGDEERFRRGLAYLPAAGGVLGIAAALLAVLVIGAVGLRMVTAGILVGVLVPLGLWWVQRGRSVFGVLRSAESWASAAAEASGNATSARYISAWAVLAVENLFLVKVVSTGFLVTGGAALWLGVGPALGSAAYAALLQQSLGEDSAKGLGTRAAPWIIGGGIALVLAGIMHMLIPGILVVLVCVLVTTPLARWVGGHGGGLDESGIRATAELIETVALLLGVFAAAAPAA